MKSIAKRNQKPLWRSPPVIGLQKSTIAKEPKYLATIGVCENGVERRTFYLNYDDKALEKLGKKLPRGLGEAEKAYIYVEKHLGVWNVFAVYLEDRTHVLLWQDTIPPAFLPDNLAY